MGEVAVGLCVGVGFLSIPIVALVLALVAKSRANRLGKELEELTSEVALLRRAMETQRKALAAQVLKAESVPSAQEPAPMSTPPAHAKPAGAGVPTLQVPVSPPPGTSDARRDVAASGPTEAPSPAAFAAATTAASTPVALPGSALPKLPVEPVETTAPTTVPSMAFESVSHSPILHLDSPPEAAPQAAGATQANGSTKPASEAPFAAPSGVSPKAPPAGRPAPPTPPSPPRPPTPVRTASGGWERRLGILVPVWIGAIALALSGAYLVKYSVEHGMLGPEMRVLLGTLLGIGLLVAGEFARKRYSVTAQGSSAAGIAVLYAVFLAAAVLYKLIPPWAGFSLVALTTATAVVLSLRQGVIVAAVGLLGGFFTPYFIGIASASPGRFFAYLLCLQGGLLVVTKKRQWTGLSALTLLLVMGAAYHRVGLPSAVNDAPWIGLLVLLSAGGFVLAARSMKKSGDRATEDTSQKWRLVLGYGSLVSALVALMALAVVTRFGLMEWGFLGLLSAACLVLGRVGTGYARLPWVAFALTGVLLTGWAAFPSADDLGKIWLVSAVFGALWAAGGWLCHIRSESPGEWGWLSAAGGLWAFGAAYLAWRAAPGVPVQGIPWGVLSLAMAVMYLGAAVYAALPARREVYGENQLAAFCTAVSAFASLAVPLELDRHWISVAWALQAAALAWLLTRIRSRALGFISCFLGSGVAMRLLLNPMVLDYPVGTVPVLNLYLYGYGIPVLAFGAAALWMERSRWKPAAEAFWWGSGALLFALLTLQVRHGFHADNIQQGNITLAEGATYSHLWLLLSAGLLFAAMRIPKTTFARIGLAVAGIAGAKFLLLDCFATNPLWNHLDAGNLPLLNGILYAYGLAVAGFALVRVLLDEGPLANNGLDGILRCMVYLASFAFVTLEIRQWFHHPFLDFGATGFLELATYSHAWFLLAGCLLVVWKRWEVPLDLAGAKFFFILACLKVLLVEAVALNPLSWHREVGSSPVLNGVLYAYGIPVVLLWLLHGMSDRPEWRKLSGPITAFGSLLLGFVLVSLEVRQYFQGTFLDGGSPANSENYAYSAAWIIFSILLLTLGIVRGGKIPRVASLVVMFIAVGKVFIYDLRHLKDLYRVGSLLGLGVSLFLISFVYQRFVFRGQDHDDDP